MIFICKDVLNKFAFVFGLVVFLCVIGDHCYGVGRNQVYHKLLAVVSDINKSRFSNTIVLHGSVAWKYIMADANDSQLVLEDMNINDVDFFIDGKFFEDVIKELRVAMSQLSFEVQSVEHNGITWCFCYFKTTGERVVRVADFVKLDDVLSSQDVLFVEGEKFNLSIAKANWIIAYEQRWLNNLKPKIINYIDIISKQRNEWLALCGNSDHVYSIYKAFNKFDEHVAMFEQIDLSNKSLFKTSLDTQLSDLKNNLDNIILKINPLLAHNFGITNSEQKKNKEMTVELSCVDNEVHCSYAKIVSQLVLNNNYDQPKNSPSKLIKRRDKKKKVKSKGGCFQMERELYGVSHLGTDLADKMHVSGKEPYASEKGLVKSRQENNIVDVENSENAVDTVLDVTNALDCLSISGGVYYDSKGLVKSRQENNIVDAENSGNAVDTVLDVTNALDCLFISGGGVYYNSGDANPFTPSFSKREYHKKYNANSGGGSLYYDSGDANLFTPSFSRIRSHKKDNANEVNSHTFCEKYFMATYSRVRYLSLLAIMIIYFGQGYSLPVDGVMEAATMLMADVSELIYAISIFAIYSESNWVVTFPTIYALIYFKYKGKKKRKKNAVAFGLLMSAYSSIYAYKFFTTYDRKIELCPLPSWLTKINRIPKYTYATPVTHKKSNISSNVFTPGEWITPDKLTCNDIVALDKALRSAQVSESGITELESCGLIDDTDISLTCYKNKWDRDRLYIELFNSERERCYYNDLCISAKPMIGVVNSAKIAGYELCCIEDGGECSLPDHYFDERMASGDLELTSKELENAEYTLKRFTPVKMGIDWSVIIKSFLGGVDVTLFDIPAYGIYIVQNIRTKQIKLAICISDNKISMTPINYTQDH